MPMPQSIFPLIHKATTKLCHFRPLQTNSNPYIGKGGTQRRVLMPSIVVTKRTRVKTRWKWLGIITKV